MRTTFSTTGKTRRAPVVTTLAAICLALPMSGIMAGTAFASSTTSPAAGDNGKSASAPGQNKQAEPQPAPQPAPAPYTNQGGVTTGSNTTKYETVADQKGSTFTGVGGGQPSGDIHSPQPYSTADKNNTGANDTSASNPYASTRNGAPSLNGNGGGQQVGQPCAACVGKADNKNPKGQAPNATDGNAGYECDRNHGIGRSNPAHTGCTAGTTTGGTTGTTTGGTTGTTTGGTSGGNSTGGSTGECTGGHMGGGNGGNDCGSTTGSSTTGGTTGANTTGGSTGASTTGGSTSGNGTGGTSGGHHGSKNGKITICHATGSSSNPFVVITVNKNGSTSGHRKHGNDIIPPYSYNDHGTRVDLPGINWTTAGQAFFNHGCTAPPAPPTCPNGQPMPISGVCGGGNGGGVTCPNGSTMPASGNVADCTPPVTCPNGSAMPASGNVGDCTPPVTCPAGTTMAPGSATCTPPVTCPAGTTMAPGSATCTPPVVCSEGAMVGPIVPGTTRPGCEVSGENGGGTIGGENGGGAQGPAKTPGTTTPGTTPAPGGVISNGGAPQPVLGGAAAPATAPSVVSARPTALPFTGGNTGRLAEGAALLLLIGGGLVMATRRKAAVTA